MIRKAGFTLALVLLAGAAGGAGALAAVGYALQSVARKAHARRAAEEQAGDSEAELFVEDWLDQLHRTGTLTMQGAVSSEQLREFLNAQGAAGMTPPPVPGSRPAPGWLGPLGSESAGPFGPRAFDEPENVTDDEPPEDGSDWVSGRAWPANWGDGPE